MPTGRKYLSFREGFFVHPLHHLEKKRQIHQLQKKVPPMFLYWNFVNFPNSASQTATLNTSKTNPSPTKTMRSHSTPVGNISSEGISSLIGVSPVQCLIEARESASEWQAHQGSLNTYIYIYTLMISHRCATIYQKQIKQVTRQMKYTKNKSNNVNQTMIKCFLGLKTALFSQHPNPHLFGFTVRFVSVDPKLLEKPIQIRACWHHS